MSNPVLNPYRNGFHTEETILKTAGQARTQTSQTLGRTWKISGNKINPISKSGMGWKLIPENGQGHLLHRSSPMHPRASFTNYNVWITPYQEGQLYGEGPYLNNFTNLADWVEQNKLANVQNTDLVLWHVFGVTHIPRNEDFPVMPST